jgi:hypothetical protein
MSELATIIIFNLLTCSRVLAALAAAFGGDSNLCPNQGCQIFLRTAYQNDKNIPKWPQKYQFG